MSLEASGDSADFYADDVKYYVATANNGYTGTITSALVPDWFLTDYMGMREDENGNITETASDQQKYFCMLFEFTGDQKGIRHALYYCKATSRPTVEAQTKGDSVEVATEEIEFSAIPLPTSSTRQDAIIKSKTTAESSNYDTWFSNAPTVPTFA